MTYNSTNLEVVYQTKLLGVICCSDGKWFENSKYLAKKGFSRLYFLRRLKDLGANSDILKEVYIHFKINPGSMCPTLDWGFEQATL